MQLRYRVLVFLWCCVVWAVFQVRSIHQLVALPLLPTSRSLGDLIQNNRDVWPSFRVLRWLPIKFRVGFRPHEAVASDRSIIPPWIPARADPVMSGTCWRSAVPVTGSSAAGTPSPRLLCQSPLHTFSLPIFQGFGLTSPGKPFAVFFLSFLKSGFIWLSWVSADVRASLSLWWEGLLSLCGARALEHSHSSNCGPWAQ